MILSKSEIYGVIFNIKTYYAKDDISSLVLRVAQLPAEVEITNYSWLSEFISQYYDMDSKIYVSDKNLLSEISSKCVDIYSDNYDDKYKALSSIITRYMIHLSQGNPPIINSQLKEVMVIIAHLISERCASSNLEANTKSSEEDVNKVITQLSSLISSIK